MFDVTFRSCSREYIIREDLRVGSVLADLSDRLYTYIRYDGALVGTVLSLRSPAPPLDLYAHEHFALDVDTDSGRARLVLVLPLDREQCGEQGTDASEFCELALTVDCFRARLVREERHMGQSVMRRVECECLGKMN